MKVADFFPANPCKDTPIGVFRFLPYNKISLSNSQLFIEDNINDYQCIPGQKEKYVPSLTITDNHLLCSVLEEIENNPELSDNFITNLLLKYPLSPNWPEEYTHIDDVRYCLSSLYLLYICYKMLIWDTPWKSIEKVWQHCMLNTLNNNDPSYIENTTTNIVSKDICIKFINSIPGDDFLLQTSFEAQEDGRITQCFFSDHLINALFFLLFRHMSAGSYSRCGSSLSLCKRCQSPYIRESLRYELCEICREGKNRTKACRERKREKMKG